MRRVSASCGLLQTNVYTPEYLVRLAQEDPRTFVPLIIKTMPPELKVAQQADLNIVIDLT